MAADAVRRRSQRCSDDEMSPAAVRSPGKPRIPVVSTNSPKGSPGKVHKAKIMSPRKQRSRVSSSLRDRGINLMIIYLTCVVLQVAMLVRVVFPQNCS